MFEIFNFLLWANSVYCNSILATGGYVSQTGRSKTSLLKPSPVNRLLLEYLKHSRNGPVQPQIYEYLIFCMDKYAVLSKLRTGKFLAAEIAGSDDECSSFVGVYPLDLSTSTSRQFVRNCGIEIVPESGIAYHIRKFSVDRKLITNDIWFGESELYDQVSKIAFSEEELVRVLGEFGVALGSLDIPANNDYPI